MSFQDLPPIEPTPGDLLMIFAHAAKLLREIRDNDPDNFGLVWDTAVTLRVALDHWIEVATPRVEGAEPPRGRHPKT